MRTFFTQNLPLKLRCALYTEPFAFIGGNLHNNTKSAKSNNSQFYATSRNKSRKKVCLALSTSVSTSGISHQSCNLFMITIENLLHFLEYFDDIVNSMKNFPLGFVKVRSTHLSFGFLNKCKKTWKRILRSWKYFPQRHLESYHMDSKSSSRTPRSWKCYRRCANRSRSIVKQKTAEENEQNSIKLDVSLIRCNIKWFVSAPVIDFRAR